MEGTKKRGLSPAQKKKVSKFLSFFFPTSLRFFSRKQKTHFFFLQNATFLRKWKIKKQKLAKAKEAILANDR